MFRVCIAGRNHAAFTEECLLSVLRQRAPLVVDWTDDASEDGAAFKLAERLLEQPHFIDWAVERRGKISNLWRAIHRAHDDEICVVFDGDDCLEPGALERIGREYEDPECWLTYGQMRNTDGSASVAHPWNGKDARNQDDFCWAPITCRAWLAKRILVEDLQIGGGWFIWSGGDVAFTLPLVEMAGPERCRYIADEWYVRRIYEDNDSARDARLQQFCGWMAACKPKYSKLGSRTDTPTRTPHLLKHGIIFAPQFDGARHVSI